MVFLDLLLIPYILITPDFYLFRKIKFYFSHYSMNFIWFIICCLQLLIVAISYYFWYLYLKFNISFLFILIIIVLWSEFLILSYTLIFSIIISFATKKSSSTFFSIFLVLICVFSVLSIKVNSFYLNISSHCFQCLSFLFVFVFKSEKMRILGLTWSSWILSSTSFNNDIVHFLIFISSLLLFSEGCIAL